MTENQNPAEDNETLQDEEVLSSALEAAKTMLWLEESHRQEAKFEEVLGDLTISPDNFELDELMDNTEFMFSVVDVFFDSMRDAAAEGREQDERENAWLEKLLTYYGYTDDEARSMIYEFLGNYRDGKDLTVWDDQSSAFYSRLTVLEQIHIEEPSGPAELTRKWGITAFERHDGFWLLQQLRDWDKDEWDSLLITPRTDHNGAFNNLGVRLEGYADRPFVVEAGSATEMAQIGARLRGRGKHFDKVIVAAHSDGDSLSLARDSWKEGAKLGITELSQPRVRQWISNLGILDQGSTLALLSCSVGKDGGLQEEVMKIPEIGETYGPKVPTTFAIIDGKVAYKAGEEGKDVIRVMSKF